MRRAAWLLGLAIFSCSNTPNETVPFQLTRVRVAPEAFLGDVPCSDQGGMQVYQATLFDVTDGLEDAFELPSSGLVSCTAAVEFEFIEPGRRYIAEVRGFDQGNLEVSSPGSTLVRTEEGQVAEGRWSTTCWGQDGITPEELGLGGAASSEDQGAGGAGPELGVESFNKSVVTVRGCEPLSDSGSIAEAQVEVSIQSALVDLECGDDLVQVESYRVAAISGEPLDPAVGGAGGADSEAAQLETAACGESLILDDVEAGVPVTFTVEGLEGLTGDVIWTTECRAEPASGLTVTATCEPASRL